MMNTSAKRESSFSPLITAEARCWPIAPHARFLRFSWRMPQVLDSLADDSVRGEPLSRQLLNRLTHTAVDGRRSINGGTVAGPFPDFPDRLGAFLGFSGNNQTTFDKVPRPSPAFCVTVLGMAGRRTKLTEQMAARIVANLR
jgi:hypothetical protein